MKRMKIMRIRQARDKCVKMILIKIDGEKHIDFNMRNDNKETQELKRDSRI